MSGDALLSASDLGVRYGSTQIIRGLDLTLLPGTDLAVVGRSGAGKTSLLRAGVFSQLPRPRNVTMVLRPLADPSRLMREGLLGLLRPGPEERARLWPLVNRPNAGRYDAYQARTEREIPLVILSQRVPTNPRGA